MGKRKNIGTKLRFEVFKRDSFTCQYCGRVAPDVILNVDHIKPVSEGGSNNILNLITSCKDCNSGKGKRQLSDQSVLSKQREQLKELQERRNQIDMMMDWHKILTQCDTDVIDRITEYLESKLNNYRLNERGKSSILKLIRCYSLSDILSAIDTCCDAYIQYDDDDNITQESAEKVISKIGSILIVNKQTKEKPYIKELYYIRGILRNRLSLGTINSRLALQWLDSAYCWGATTDNLRDIALSCSTFDDFIKVTDDLIHSYKSLEE